MYFFTILEVLSLKSVSQSQNQGVCRATTPSSSFEVESILCLFQLLQAILCLVAATPRNSRRASSSFSYSACLCFYYLASSCVCGLVKSSLCLSPTQTFVMTLWDHPDKPGKSPHLQTLNVITFAKALIPNEGSFTGSRGLDLISSGAIIQPTQCPSK